MKWYRPALTAVLSLIHGDEKDAMLAVTHVGSSNTVNVRAEDTKLIRASLLRHHSDGR